MANTRFAHKIWLALKRWLQGVPTPTKLLISLVATVVSVVAVAQLHSTQPSAGVLSSKARLGKAIYNDEQLSVARNMSCATCHSIAAGGTAASDISNQRLGLHPGSLFEGYDTPPSAKNTFAWRNIQSNTYAVFSPPLHREQSDDGSVTLVGGNFWDGRALGFLTGRPTQEQATVPPLGTLEQGLPAPACVVQRVVRASANEGYTTSYQSIYGNKINAVQWPDNLNTLCQESSAVVDMNSASDDALVQRAYVNISNALWAYQKSAEIVPFSSKFDAYTQGHATLSASEQRGLELFNNKAKCASCHVSKSTNPLQPALFTDFTYDNLGVPRNPSNPIYNFPLINPLGRNWVDLGLGEVLKHQDSMRDEYTANLGKFKVPTLRNVDRKPTAEFTRAYMHNGYFRSLEQVVDFYNTRDVKPRCANRFTSADDAEQQGCWPEPESSDNLNRAELGNLQLSDQEQHDLVNFMKTLTDT